MVASPSDDAWSVVDMIDQSPPVDCSKPYDTSTLAGKTILITGGASGFGAAFARHWARHGAHLIIGDVNDRAGEALVAELRSSSSPDQVILYQHCDVTSWSDQLALFKTAASSSKTKSIDAVVAGAGIVERGDPTTPSATSTVFDLPHALDSDSTTSPPPPPPLRVLAVNLTGVMYTTHLALYYLPLRAGGDRHLLLISSVAGLMPLVGQTEYTVSKHGVMGLFRALRGSAWTRGIRVNALTPYFVDTPLLPKPALALLAGAAKADLEDVVDAATRLMADWGIRGRALAVGPKMRVVDDEGDGSRVRMVEGEGRHDGERRQAVWEVYGHDYERVEVFVWRYLAVLNVMRRVRGWVGLVTDMLGLCFGKRA
ncbi:NAD(P)-binding protein [Parathielavia hyrcaniae]|uniref:NAD(P)-binding protein n=1 Tax=Parathielavia hyrcaniae TaxID=113614 RepID=A0AAN6Q721_9PEZI|nr:NAD(P)-binding protein [Parathielavia hyrcaniae]